MSINLRWPAKRGNNYSPWYVIGWRLLWYPLLIASKCLLVLVAFAGWGPQTASRVWHEIQ